MWQSAFGDVVASRAETERAKHVQCGGEPRVMLLLQAQPQNGHTMSVWSIGRCCCSTFSRKLGTLCAERDIGQLSNVNVHSCDCTFACFAHARAQFVALAALLTSSSHA